MTLTDNDYRRRDDEAITRLIAAMEQQNVKIDRMGQQMHTMEIHIAELKAIHSGRVEQVEYRVDKLECNQKSAFGYIFGIIMAFATAVTMWVVQQWGAGTLQK